MRKILDSLSFLLGSSWNNNLERAWARKNKHNQSTVHSVQIAVGHDEQKNEQITPTQPNWIQGTFPSVDWYQAVFAYVLYIRNTKI